MTRRHFTLIELCTASLLVTLMFVPVIGFIMNVVALIGCDFNPIDKEEIIRGIGIFVPPIGCILGFISF